MYFFAHDCTTPFFSEPHQLASEAKSTYNESLKLYVCPHCNLQLKAGMTNHLKWHKQHPSEVLFFFVKSQHSNTKAKLLQLKLTPIICLMNFINKKVGNRKN